MTKKELKSLIREIIREESGAAKKAKAAGLVYAKFGRWKDPKTNKVVALSRGEDLEKVTRKEDDKPKASNAAEKAAIDFLSKVVKASKWKGKVYLAGGYVRDELLGRDAKDIDLVVASLDGLHVGAGTAWELGYAYANNIPCIGIKMDEPVEDALEYLSAILIGSMEIVSSIDELKEKLKRFKDG